MTQHTFTVETTDLKTWMAKVDELFAARFGVTTGDVPDFLWDAEFEDGASPREAIDAYLEEYGDELGMDDDDDDDDDDDWYAEDDDRGDDDDYEDYDDDF